MTTIDYRQEMTPASILTQDITKYNHKQLKLKMAIMEIGIKFKSELEVTCADTAISAGSGTLRVLATPVVILATDVVLLARH